MPTLRQWTAQGRAVDHGADGVIQRVPDLYELTGVLVKEMAKEMTAMVRAGCQVIATSGRADVYGITFATGQATITAASDQVLSDVLAGAHRHLLAQDRGAYR